MRAGIHQPHYMPWQGFLDKMAKSDVFVIMDDVQLADRSAMRRNKFVDVNGREVVLSVDLYKKNYRDKKTREIRVNYEEKWNQRHEKFFLMNYKKHPFFEEIWEKAQGVYTREYEYLIDLDMDTIVIFRELLNINTPLLMQSALPYDPLHQKNELLIDLCLGAGATQYFSGSGGGREYMEEQLYAQNGLSVMFQQFTSPVYPQKHGDFIANLSALDMLFNCGMEESRRIFWENVRSSGQATGDSGQL